MSNLIAQPRFMRLCRSPGQETGMQCKIITSSGDHLLLARSISKGLPPSSGQKASVEIHVRLTHGPGIPATSEHRRHCHLCFNDSFALLVELSYPLMRDQMGAI